MDYDAVSRRLRSRMTDRGWTLDETAKLTSLMGKSIDYLVGRVAESA